MLHLSPACRKFSANSSTSAQFRFVLRQLFFRFLTYTVSNAPAYTIIATQHPAPQQENRRPQPDFTAILLVLVRLAEQKTDIVITINVPHVPGEYAKDEVDFAAARQGPLMDTAAAIRQQILQTFEIKDFGLFGTEEEE